MEMFVMVYITTLRTLNFRW